jgi:hypothetical protein
MMNLLADHETEAPDEWLIERMRLRRDALLSRVRLGDDPRYTNRQNGMGDLPPSLAGLPSNMDTSPHR